MLRGAVGVGYRAGPGVQLGATLFDVKAAVAVAGDIGDIRPGGGTATQDGSGQQKRE